MYKVIPKTVLIPFTKKRNLTGLKTRYFWQEASVRRGSQVPGHLYWHKYALVEAKL